MPRSRHAFRLCAAILIAIGLSATGCQTVSGLLPAKLTGGPPNQWEPENAGQDPAEAVGQGENFSELFAEAD